MGHLGCSYCDECPACGSCHKKKIEETLDRVEQLENQLDKAKKFIGSWAWTGDNGSPYTEQQAKRLQSLIQNDAWTTYIEIFGVKP